MQVASTPREEPLFCFNLGKRTFSIKSLSLNCSVINGGFEYERAVVWMYQRSHSIKANVPSIESKLATTEEVDIVIALPTANCLGRDAQKLRAISLDTYRSREDEYRKDATMVQIIRKRAPRPLSAMILNFLKTSLDTNLISWEIICNPHNLPAEEIYIEKDGPEEVANSNASTKFIKTAYLNVGMLEDIRQRLYIILSKEDLVRAHVTFDAVSVVHIPNRAEVIKLVIERAVPKSKPNNLFYDWDEDGDLLIKRISEYDRMIEAESMNSEATNENFQDRNHFSLEPAVSQVFFVRDLAIEGEDIIQNLRTILENRFPLPVDKNDLPDKVPISNHMSKDSMEFNYTLLEKAVTNIDELEWIKNHIADATDLIWAAVRSGYYIFSKSDENLPQSDKLLKLGSRDTFDDDDDDDDDQLEPVSDAQFAGTCENVKYSDIEQDETESEAGVDYEELMLFSKDEENEKESTEKETLDNDLRSEYGDVFVPYGDSMLSTSIENSRTENAIDYERDLRSDNIIAEKLQCWRYNYSAQPASDSTESLDLRNDNAEQQDYEHGHKVNEKLIRLFDAPQSSMPPWKSRRNDSNSSKEAEVEKLNKEEASSFRQFSKMAEGNEIKSSDLAQNQQRTASMGISLDSQQHQHLLRSLCMTLSAQKRSKWSPISKVLNRKKRRISELAAESFREQQIQFLKHWVTIAMPYAKEIAEYILMFLFCSAVANICALLGSIDPSLEQLNGSELASTIDGFLEISAENYNFLQQRVFSPIRRNDIWQLFHSSGRLKRQKISRYM